MNCEAGDLAVIVMGKHAGWIVHVVKAAPKRRFLLPDGYPSEAGPYRLAAWVCESSGSMFCAQTGLGPRKARYAVIEDFGLRPIRDPGEDAQDESLAWLPPVPATTKERETA